MEDLIDKAQVIRAIETLKARHETVSPINVAFELGVPRNFIYNNIELLEIIFLSSGDLLGPDQVIEQLLKENKSLKRKVKKLDKQIDEEKKLALTSFNEGFAKGASMNFSEVKLVKEKFLVDEFILKQEELWARGVLMIDTKETLDLDKIKKAYRTLAAIVHPDSSSRDTNVQITNVNRAYEFLKNLLESKKTNF